MAHKIIALVRSYALLLPILLIGAWYVAGNAFIQDDAYITYNYAKHFALGHGLVWYPGSTEFGYTNFFYTFMIGVAMLFGTAPEAASDAINIASFLGCLCVGYAISVRVLGNRLLALLPVFLLATHHTFTAYATGGLETMWVTLLVLVFYWHILTRHERDEAGEYLVLGTLAAVALLSRLDTAFLLLPGYVFMALRAGRGTFAQLLRMRNAVIIPIVVMAGFLFSCYVAYGFMLPNTFYIKMPGDNSMLQNGLNYLKLYNTLHLYMPLAVFGLLCIFIDTDNLRTVDRFFYPALALLILWLGYIVFVGGDFMEFRLLVPVLPYFLFCIFYLCTMLPPTQIPMGVLSVTVLLFLGNSWHTKLRHDAETKPSGVIFLSNVDSVRALDRALTEQPNNWRTSGQRLHELFYTGKDSDVKIAVTAAGAIPYYSGLPVVDQLGLNTRAILYNGVPYLSSPGHRLRISRAYMQRTGVNLVIDHPMYIRGAGRCSPAPRFFLHQPLPDVPRIYIPINGGSYLLAYYLNEHPAIETLIETQQIIRCMP